MSKRETPLTRRYWKSVGGTLIEEFAAVPRGPDHGPRTLDGVIIKGGSKRIARKSEVDLKGKDIIVVQTKASRLGMNLAGQTLFSRELMKKYKPRTIRSVAVCTKGDSVLEPLLTRFKNVEVVVYEKE
jgi:hypothetical protein